MSRLNVKEIGGRNPARTTLSRGHVYLGRGETHIYV